MRQQEYTSIPLVSPTALTVSRWVEVDVVDAGRLTTRQPFVDMLDATVRIAHDTSVPIGAVTFQVTLATVPPVSDSNATHSSPYDRSELKAHTDQPAKRTIDAIPNTQTSR